MINSTTQLFMLSVFKHIFFESSMSQTSDLLNYIIKRYLYNNEATWDDITERVSKLFPPIKSFMSNMEFIPGGRNLANINTDHVLVPNCVVVNIEDNLTDIFNTLTRLVELTRRGAGIGMNFGKLRPANSHAKHFDAFSCGPVGFLNMYSIHIINFYFYIINISSYIFIFCHYRI